MKLPTLMSLAAAFDVDLCDIIPMPEARCNECHYSELPSDGGHCYMFQDPPKDDKCGAFEPMHYKLEWKK